ncbi:hypothetical protein [Cryobacterium sp. BB736]|uniref:hypothetical protein n=1 Tax=Cryobacterium sp. BB736 TaxID=2746963 RepID=UPI001875D75E|nr:hypothetical protein [Cryobacterium sp. BB736]
MAEILNPSDNEGKHRPISRSSPTRPYSPEEIADLRSWAATQSTELRRRDAWTMLALGLGAGLATRELLELQSTDVMIGPDRSTAQVIVWRDRTRAVPLLTAWVPTLLRTVAESPPGGWLFRPGRQKAMPGQVTDFLTRSRSPLDVRPSRMRATWLNHHLNEGTPADEILRISGLKNFAALDRLLPMTDRHSDAKNS